MHFFENTSRGRLLPASVAGMVSKGPASPFATKSLVPPPFLPSHLQHRHWSSPTVSKFKELKSQPANPTKHVVSWPLFQVPEPTHSRAVVAAALAWGRWGNTSAGRLQTTLWEAIRPRLAAMTPQQWHPHRNWPCVEPLPSKQGRT